MGWGDLRSLPFQCLQRDELYRTGEARSYSSATTTHQKGRAKTKAIHIYEGDYYGKGRSGIPQSA